MSHDDYIQEDRQKPSVEFWKRVCILRLWRFRRICELERFNTSHKVAITNMLFEQYEMGTSCRTLANWLLAEINRLLDCP